MNAINVMPLAAAALFGLTGAGTAQDLPAKAARIQSAPASRARPAQSELIANREAKLHKPFLKNAHWFLDYDKAREEAKKTGKPIFAYFTRSYAH